MCFLNLSKKQTSNSETLALAKVYDIVWELFTCIISMWEKALVGTCCGHVVMSFKHVWFGLNISSQKHQTMLRTFEGKTMQ